MMMTAELNSSCRSCMSSRIWACTVTSRAVVGSSAISSVGVVDQRHRDHRPLAHAAGELVRVVVEALGRVGDAAPGRASRWPAPWPACLETSVCAPGRPRRSGRRPCRTGAGARAGPGRSSRSSCPRSDRMSLGVGHADELLAVQPDLAGDLRPVPLCSPRIAWLVTDLPEPDSPTMPSVLPRSSVKLSPSTARTRPSSVGNCTRRSRTSRKACGGGERVAGCGPWSMVLTWESSGCIRVADPRVDDGVEDVDDDVGHDDEHGGRRWSPP